MDSPRTSPSPFLIIPFDSSPSPSPFSPSSSPSSSSSFFSSPSSSFSPPRFPPSPSVSPLSLGMDSSTHQEALPSNSSSAAPSSCSSSSSPSSSSSSPSSSSSSCPLEVHLDPHSLPVTVTPSLHLPPSPSVPLYLSSLSSHVDVICGFSSSWNEAAALAQRDPSCLIARLFFVYYLSAAGKDQEAVHHLAGARALFAAHSHCSPAHYTRREELYLDGFEALYSGRTRRALDLFSSLLSLFPADLFALKLAQGCAFGLSDVPLLLSIPSSPAVVQAQAHRPYFHSILLFGLEENDRLEAAFATGQRALSLCPADIWAVHGLLHSLHAGGAPLLPAALSLAREHEGLTRNRHSFMYTHYYFHWALLLLDNDEEEEAVKMIRDHVWVVGEEEEEEGGGGRKRGGEGGEGGKEGGGEGLGEEKALPSPSPPSMDVESLPPSPPSPFSFSLDLSLYPTLPLHDKRQTDDQNNAMNVGWRWEIRATGLGRKNGEGEGQGGERGDFQRCPLLDDYYRDIAKYIPSFLPSPSPSPSSPSPSSPSSSSSSSSSSSPPPAPRGLTGLLQLRTLCRAGEKERALCCLQAIERHAAEVEEKERKEKNEEGEAEKKEEENPAEKEYATIYWPLALAIYHTASLSAPPSSSSSSSSSSSASLPLAPPALQALSSIVPLFSPSEQSSLPSPSLVPEAERVLKAVGGSGEQRQVLSEWIIDAVARGMGEKERAKKMAEGKFKKEELDMNYWRRFMILCGEE